MSVHTWKAKNIVSTSKETYMNLPHRSSNIPSEANSILKVKTIFQVCSHGEIVTAIYLLQLLDCAEVGDVVAITSYEYSILYNPLVLNEKLWENTCNILFEWKHLYPLPNKYNVSVLNADMSFFLFKFTQHVVCLRLIA